MSRTFDVLFLLNLFAAGTGFLTILTLGRLLGPEGFGAYAFALAWINLAVMVTTLGFHHFLIRALPPMVAGTRHGEARGLVLLAGLLGSGLAIGLAAAAPGLLAAMPPSDNAALVEALLAATALLVPMTLNQMRSGLLRGMSRPIEAQVPELAVQPVLFLAGIGTLVALGRSLNPTLVLEWLAVVLWVALLCGAVPAIAALRAIPRAPLLLRTGRWLAEALKSSLVFSAMTIMTATDVVVLGLLSTAEQTGLYGLASRFFLMMQIPAIVASGVLSHEVARLSAAGAHRALGVLVRQTATRTVLAATGLAVPLTGLALAPELVFGTGFAAASLPMLILIWSRVGEATFGHPGAVLGNGGHLGLTGRLVAASALVNLLMNLALVPALGAVGAALATATAHLLLTVALVMAVRRHFGVLSLPLFPAIGGRRT